jgi:hypothetical protein
MIVFAQCGHLDLGVDYRWGFHHVPLVLLLLYRLSMLLLSHCLSELVQMLFAQLSVGVRAPITIDLRHDRRRRA